MTVYVVSYDIKQGHGAHDYQHLYDAFAQLDCVKILYSVYLVSTSFDATKLHEYLRQYMDPLDRIWVSRVTSDHSGFVMDAGVNWLTAHPPN